MNEGSGALTGRLMEQLSLKRWKDSIGLGSLWDGHRSKAHNTNGDTVRYWLHKK